MILENTPTGNSIFLRKSQRHEDEDIDSVIDDLTNGDQGPGVDAEDFFHVLNGIFKELQVLNTAFEKNTHKFQFLEDYPDELYDPSTHVATYNVEHRYPIKISNKSVTGQSTSYSRPQIDEEIKNFKTGNIDQRRVMQFENVVSITCFSMKSNTVKQMCNLIESILIKYRGYLRRYVAEITYLGQTGIQVIGSYDAKRFFSKELTFKIITSETFILSFEELKTIEASLNI